MTSPSQRSTRTRTSSISSEAALVGALAAFGRSPTTSPITQKHYGPKSPRPVAVPPPVKPKPPVTINRTVTTPAQQNAPNRLALRSIPASLSAAINGPLQNSRPLKTGQSRERSSSRSPARPPIQRRPVSRSPVRPRIQRGAGSRSPGRPPLQRRPTSRSPDRPAAQRRPVSRSPNRPPAQKRLVQSAKPKPLQSIEGALHSDATSEKRTPLTSSLVHLFEGKITKDENHRNGKVDAAPPGTFSPALPKIDGTSRPIHRDVGTTPKLEPSIGFRQKIPLSETGEMIAAPEIAEPQFGTTAQIPEINIMSSPDSFRSAKTQPSPVKAIQSVMANKPSLPPPRRAAAPLKPTSSIRNRNQRTQSLGPGPGQADPKSRAKSPYMNVQAASSTQSIAAQYHQLHPRRMSALQTGDSLANAIVASSIASSRAPSPSKPSPGPPTSLRNQRSHQALFKSRTPSPPKKTPALRQTLRKEPSTSSTDSDSSGDPYSKHKKKRHIRKHPNKHHEGDRKRWRNAVTERERKRYEGVWAANKGHLCGFATSEQQDLAAAYRDDDADKENALRRALAEQVSGIVVRDLWARSRLPQHVLAEVWQLVDTSGSGRLTRDEFVVGLWLVDQRLKGRKLPSRVGESVWNSVRYLQGIKMRSKWEG